MYYECKWRINTLWFVKKIYEEWYNLDWIKNYQVAIAQVNFISMKDEDIYYFYKVESPSLKVYRYSSEQSRCIGEKQWFTKHIDDTGYMPDKEIERRNKVEKELQNIRTINILFSIQTEIKKDMWFLNFLFPTKYFESVIKKLCKVKEQI